MVKASEDMMPNAKDNNYHSYFLFIFNAFGPVIFVKT